MTPQTDNGGVVHFLLSAEERPWQDCLRSCKATDTVVLLDTAVLGLTRSGRKAIEEFPCRVVASGVDVNARIGVTRSGHATINLIGDDELIMLLAEHSHCLSWR